MAAAAPLRGMFRCFRLENPEIPVLHIDSDALGVPGRAGDLAAEIQRELSDFSDEVPALRRRLVSELFGVLDAPGLTSAERFATGKSGASCPSWTSALQGAGHVALRRASR